MKIETMEQLLKFMKKRNLENEEIKFECFYQDRCFNTDLFSTIDFIEGLGFVEDVFAVRETKKEISFQHIATFAESKERIIVKNIEYRDYGMGRGLKVHFKKPRTRYYYQQNFFTNTYYISHLDNKKFYRKNLFTAEDIAHLDSTFKHCAYTQNQFITFIDYVPLFREHPNLCETLMKLNLFKLITKKALEELETNKSLRNYIFKNQESIRKKDIAFTTAKNAWKKNKVATEDYYNSLMYRNFLGRQLSMTDKALYNKILKYTTREKISAYLKNNKIAKSLYQDYLSACDYFNLDFSDTKILFPKDFETAHNQRTNEYGEAQRMLSELANKKIDDELMKVAKEFKFLETQLGDYVTKLPQSKYDLIEEGDKLKHCVGKMNYDLKMAKKESIIVFVREKDKIDQPYATVEINVGSKLKIQQCYGYQNKEASNILNLMEDFINKINRRKSTLRLVGGTA